ncbi:hypothetical protein Hanom_Chr04g00320011 [Helianthus anomalus]
MTHTLIAGEDLKIKIVPFTWFTFVTSQIHSLEGGKHACVDLTGVSPLAGFRENTFVAGQAVLKAESKKVEKHAKACEDNPHAFVPLAFDTFGSLAPEAVRFLVRVQRVVHSNFSTPQGRGFVFSKLGFSIQKGMAVQLVARLPVYLSTCDAARETDK